MKNITLVLNLVRIMKRLKENKWTKKENELDMFLNLEII